jgi:hypothetical protein
VVGKTSRAPRLTTCFASRVRGWPIVQNTAQAKELKGLFLTHIQVNELRPLVNARRLLLMHSMQEHRFQSLFFTRRSFWISSICTPQ